MKGWVTVLLAGVLGAGTVVFGGPASKVDPARRNERFEAAKARMGTTVMEPAANAGVQGKAFGTKANVSFEGREAIVNGKRTGIFVMGEMREKKMVERKDAYAMSGRFEKKTALFAKVEAPMQTETKGMKFTMAERIQEKMREAPVVRMQVMPETKKKATAEDVNKFVQRKGGGVKEEETVKKAGLGEEGKSKK